ncbi:Hpt domain-containing protein [Vitreimonas flagellata]|uniref:Hpt domain-containing protein n=1 Tax=Vitreimonas flagellata TaxID=2560861 RepID=UPI001074BA87|nr:Hpt domain-containing protein [Vitreimonas flagellata]
MTILDRAHFDHMTGADRALQLEILELFRGQVSGWRGAFASGAGWREALHAMKGSARGIGFTQLAATCEAAEQADEAGRAEVLGQVEAALSEALVALEQFAADAP